MYGFGDITRTVVRNMDDSSASALLFSVDQVTAPAISSTSSSDILNSNSQLVKAPVRATSKMLNNKAPTAGDQFASDLDRAILLELDEWDAAFAVRTAERA